MNLAKLTTFHPLNEPVTFPDEDEALKILKVENYCSEKKLVSEESVKSSGREK